MPEQKNYYKILGVDENASLDEIKKVYRKLAREDHPDKNQDKPGAEDRFKEISEAYAVLSDVEKRKDYDNLRRNPFFGASAGAGAGRGAGGGPFRGDPFTASSGSRFYRRPDGTYVRMDTGGFPGGGTQEGSGGSPFSDLFSQFFGGSSAETRPRGPATDLDRKRTVRISFRRMIAGGKIKLDLDGEKLSIPIPRGVADGYRIRIRGRGNQAPDGTRGDLYVTINVTPVDGIRRDGLDLHTEAHVNVFEAMFGTQGSVKLPLGKHIKVTIPPGVQPGEVLRIKGKGIETDKGTGNLLVHVVVDVPRNLSAKQEAILKEAARKAGLQKDV